MSRICAYSVTRHKKEVGTMTQQIENFIHSIFNTYNITIPYEIEHHTGSPNQSYAAFNAEKNCIYFRLIPLEKAYYGLKKDNITFDLPTFVEIVIFHEVGHALDQKTPFFHEEKQKLLNDIHSIKSEHEADHFIEKLGNIMFESEKNAWDYADTHIQHTDCYQKYKEICIYGYAHYLENLRTLVLKHIA